MSETSSPKGELQHPTKESGGSWIVAARLYNQSQAKQAGPKANIRETPGTQAWDVSQEQSRTKFKGRQAERRERSLGDKPGTAAKSSLRRKPLKGKKGDKLGRQGLLCLPSA